MVLPFMLKLCLGGMTLHTKSEQQLHQWASGQQQASRQSLLLPAPAQGSACVLVDCPDARHLYPRGALPETGLKTVQALSSAPADPISLCPAVQGMRPPMPYYGMQEQMGPYAMQQQALGMGMPGRSGRGGRMPIQGGRMVRGPLLHAPSTQMLSLRDMQQGRRFWQPALLDQILLPNRHQIATARTCSLPLLPCQNPGGCICCLCRVPAGDTGCQVGDGAACLARQTWPWE